MQPRRPPALALNVAAAPGAGYGIGSEDADPDLNDLGDSWKITHQGALQVGFFITQRHPIHVL